MNARPLRLALLILLALVVASAQMAPSAQTLRASVYVVMIEGVIDLGLAPYVKRALREAESAGAAALVLDINTFGGRVDAAVQIRDALLNSKMRSIAFINKRAISAGALISLAANQIVMGTGGTVGAATPVQLGGPGGGALPVEEKTVSYVRKEFRATAESRGRPPLLAEAMVDASVVVPGVVEKGKLLTLTTEEALLHKMADFRADTLEDALRRAGLADAQVRKVEPNWAENLVRFLTHPVVSSLLMSVAMLGILLELRTPGFGVPGALGVGSLGLFLWGHWLVQLAGWEEILMAAAGIVLLLLEVFVIPGFGIAGALGILALLGALLLSMIGPGNTGQLVLLVASRVVFSLLLAIGLSFALFRFMSRLPIGRKLVLQTGLDSAQGYASGPEQDAGLLGKTGQARSALRPAGIAEIDGRRVDVVSDGDMIEPGARIEVVQVDGNRVVVRRGTTPEQRST